MDSAASESSAGLPSLLEDCHALVTGASSGLGAEFARQLAPRAASIILGARNRESLEALALQLRQTHPALRVAVCACDLTTAEGRATLWNAVDESGIEPTILINNAGLGDYGAFTDADEARLRAQIDVNVTAVTLLAHEFVRRAGAGRSRPRAILNTSSLAASIPMPDLAVYAASKAYVTSFSEALAIELAPAQIRVLAICPGPTPTNFSTTARRADGRDTNRSGQEWLRMPAPVVVSTSLAALEGGKVRHFPSWRVRLAAAVFECVPRPVIRCILGLRHRRSLLE